MNVLMMTSDDDIYGSAQAALHVWLHMFFCIGGVWRFIGS
jgi:hypothetical protein